jgi:hypothetical protein
MDEVVMMHLQLLEWDGTWNLSGDSLQQKGTLTTRNMRIFSTAIVVLWGSGV